MKGNNQVTITVSGGSVVENRQLTSIVHACLVEKGFVNADIGEFDRFTPSDQPQTVYDIIKMVNPDLLDTPIHVTGQNDQEIAAIEYAAAETAAQEEDVEDLD